MSNSFLENQSDPDKDYFFDCNGEYYYLHFGVSD
jgi:hypothetical protein